MKSMNWISQTGRIPMYEAPIAEPTIACSEIGASITRGFAVLFDQPFGCFERATVGADVFADQKDALVARHFFEEGLADGFEVGDYGHGDCTNSSVGSA